MKNLWYLLVFIVFYVWTGKHTMGEALDFYDFVKTMRCVEKVKKNAR